MRTRALIRLAVIVSVAGFATAAFAASADDFKAAYAKAEAASKEAAKLKTQWTTTTKALKAAEKAGRRRQVRRSHQARQRGRSLGQCVDPSGQGRKDEVARRGHPLSRA